MKKPKRHTKPRKYATNLPQNNNKTHRFCNTIFGGIESDAAASAKLRRMQRSSTHIKLNAAPLWNQTGSFAEFLVAVSWRGSITSIPRAIIPVNTGGYRVFGLGPDGLPSETRRQSNSYTAAYLDDQHLVSNRKCNKERTRWAVLRIYRPSAFTRTPFGRYELRFIPKQQWNTPGYIDKKSLPSPQVFHTPPAFEIDEMSAFYSKMLKNLGNFMGSESDTPTNNMMRYYQYMNMPLGAFVDMYGFCPDQHPEAHVPTVHDDVANMAPAEPVATKPANIRSIVDDAASIETYEAKPQEQAPKQQQPHNNPTPRRMVIRGGVG